MRHLIIGTAGHVDHGKTALVRALTGIECDTHAEERRRGITINLGFAHLDLPSGLRLGVIDVPGHRDFVHTMAAGVAGMDLAMLVIAANEGVMPQTLEHLRILDCLGVRGGVVVLNKIDLLQGDPDLLALAMDEIAQVLKGTFLESCPIMPVSARTGEGLPNLIACLEALAAKVPPRTGGQAFRMFIDRIFSVSGFGSVVTGSAIGGRLRRDSAVLLLPGDTETLRIRRIERHGQEVEEVEVGDRVSLNLVGLERSAFRRGMVISDRALPATRRIDVTLRLFSSETRLGLWSTVLFHASTFESSARIHLMDRERLSGADGQALAQIDLSHDLVALSGDRFIIRSSSGDTTLGGGTIIDPAPLHHRRRSAKVVSAMQEAVSCDLSTSIAQQVRKAFAPVTATELSNRLDVPLEQVQEAFNTGLPADLQSVESSLGPIVILGALHARLLRQVEASIAGFHRKRPLLATGRTREELMGGLPLTPNQTSWAFLDALLEAMERSGILRLERRTWVSAKHQVVLDETTRRAVADLDRLLLESGMQVPIQANLQEIAVRNGLSEARLKEVLFYLVSLGKAVHHEGEFLHATVVERCRQALRRRFASDPSGLTVAGFRDLVEGNRKICLLLLAIFDHEGTTRRDGDQRFLIA